MHCYTLHLPDALDLSCCCSESNLVLLCVIKTVVFFLFYHRHLWLLPTGPPAQSPQPFESDLPDKKDPDQGEEAAAVQGEGVVVKAETGAAAHSVSGSSLADSLQAAVEVRGFCVVALLACADFEDSALASNTPGCFNQRSMRHQPEWWLKCLLVSTTFSAG